jgi:anti-sigma factor (TIGR02949 family)
MRSDDFLSCEAALDLIEPSLDGDLDAGEEARLRAHLAACAACAAELAFAQRVQRELRALPQPEVPPELLARVVQAGRGEIVPFPVPRAAPRLPAGRLRIAAAAAVAILALGGGSLFFHGQKPDDRPSPEQIAEATREARFALATLGKATRRAGLDVRDEVLQKRLVVPAALDASQSLSRMTDAAGEPRKEL